MDSDRLTNPEATNPEATNPDARLIRAVAQLLHARVELYKVQPGHELIPKLDRTLSYLLAPQLGVNLGDF